MPNFVGCFLLPKILASCFQAVKKMKKVPLKKQKFWFYKQIPNPKLYYGSKELVARS